MECPKCVSKATPDPSCSVCRGSGEASWTKPAVQRERYPGELRSAAVKPRETVQQAQARERGEARARATDPGTSHAAADSITAGAQQALRDRVLGLLDEFGPCHDDGLVRRYRDVHGERGWPIASESGIRTRRNELVAEGKVEDTGRTITLPSGRRSIVWRRKGDLR